MMYVRSVEHLLHSSMMNGPWSSGIYSMRAIWTRNLCRNWVFYLAGWAIWSHTRQISNGDENPQNPSSTITKVMVNVNIHDNTDYLLCKASGTLFPIHWNWTLTWITFLVEEDETMPAWITLECCWRAKARGNKARARRWHFLQRKWIIGIGIASHARRYCTQQQVGGESKACRSLRGFLYTVEIVIMHRMIMHKSHIAWVFLGTKLSKHGIVPWKYPL